MQFWDKMWHSRDPSFIIAASMTGAVGFVLIGLWALQAHNQWAMVLNVLGIAQTDVTYRVMGSERDDPNFSDTTVVLAIISWVFPVLAVALLVFLPPLS